jgi:hypothetical protein
MGGVGVMYDKGDTEMIVDGNWRKSRLSERAYEKKVQEADVQFNHLVTLLLDGLTSDFRRLCPARIALRRSRTLRRW